VLLEAGLAQIHRPSIRDSPYQTEFLIAEDSAKKMKKKLWLTYDPVKEEEARQKRIKEENEQHKPKQELFDVIITEIVDASTFYVQIVSPEAEKLEALMKGLAIDDNSNAFIPQKGDLVKAQFTADDAWYRAEVIAATAEGNFKVFYLDYGNSEAIPSSRIRKLGSEFGVKELKPQAHEAQLAYIQPPKLNEDYGQDAAEFLKDLVWGKTMLANVEYREEQKLFLSLGDRESQVHVNAALLRAGLARVKNIRSRHLREVLEKLKLEEDKARAAHAFIWEYGDPGSDDEEERPIFKGASPAVPQKKGTAEANKKENKAEPAAAKKKE